MHAFKFHHNVTTEVEIYNPFVRSLVWNICDLEGSRVRMMLFKGSVNPDQNGNTETRDPVYSDFTLYTLISWKHFAINVVPNICKLLEKDSEGLFCSLIRQTPHSRELVYTDGSSPQTNCIFCLSAKSKYKLLFLQQNNSRSTLKPETQERPKVRWDGIPRNMVKTGVEKMHQNNHPLSQCWLLIV